MKALVNDIYANLKGIPQDKIEHVAIWGWTAEGTDLLTLAINERIHVKYFIDYNRTIYKNKFIFDKRVINREELMACKDIYVIMGRKSFEEERTWIENNLQGRYLVVDIGELAEELTNPQGGIYIYGAGIAGQRTMEILKEKGIEIDGYLDSAEQKVGTIWCDYPIYSRKVLQEEDIVIISSLYWLEIYDSLKNEFNQEHIFVDYRNSRISDHTIRFEEMNSIWIKYQDYPLEPLQGGSIATLAFLVDFTGKEISIYGNNKIAEQLVEIFQCIGMTISQITDDIGDFAYQDLKNQMILITKIDDKVSKINRRIVVESGDAFADWDISYYSQWRPITDVCGAKRKMLHDQLVNISIINIGHQYQGFYTHGILSESKRKIVVLGGSTTEAELYANYITSWPEFLAQKRDDIIIYNGGVAGFTSVQECLKLLRDVIHINPDLVISYSGVNDWRQIRNEKQPFKGAGACRDLYYGLESNMKKYEYWILMERYMHAVSRVNGSDFIAILQTMSTLRKDQDASSYEQLLPAYYEDCGEYNAFVSEIQGRMQEYEWMYDLSNPFEGIKGTVFRDLVHLNNEGNSIIADRISDIIDDYYSKQRI